MVALPFAIGVGASECIAQSGGVVTLALSIKTSVFSTPPTSVQRRCAPFGVVYAPGYRVGNVTHILADVGYLNHFIHLESL